MLSLSKKRCWWKKKKLSFCYHHHNYLKVTIVIISRTFPGLHRPFPVAFSCEECCETAALSRIKLLSKVHFILTTASGCIDTTMKQRLGISFPGLQVQDISSQQIFAITQMTKALSNDTEHIMSVTFGYLLKNCVIDYLQLYSAMMLIAICMNMKCEEYIEDRNVWEGKENKRLTERERQVHKPKWTIHKDNR